MAYIPLLKRNLIYVPIWIDLDIVFFLVLEKLIVLRFFIDWQWNALWESLQIRVVCFTLYFYLCFY